MNKLQVFEGTDGQWYWRLRGRNNEVVCQSEGYTSKSNAMRAGLNFPKIVARGVVMELKETEHEPTKKARPATTKTSPAGQEPAGGSGGGLIGAAE